MKKVLYGTSAIVAASLVSGAAYAQGPELTIGGQTDIAYIVQDSDGLTGDGTDGDAISHNNNTTQLLFDFEATADNGLTYGGRIDWRTGSDSLDEHYVYFEGGWGRVHFGGDDSVLDNNVPGGESVTAGNYLWDGSLTGGIDNAATMVGNTFPTLTASTVDANKIAYYSPSFAGFSVGVDYTPDNTQGQGFGAFTSGVVNGADHNGAAYSGTVAYDATFGAADVSLGVGYGFSETGDNFSDDSEGLMAGATVGIAGFNVGVGYGDNMDSPCNAAGTCTGGGWWNIAANYGFGAATVYGGYMQSEFETPAGDDEMDQYGAGIDYAMAEGLRTYVEIFRRDFTVAASGNESESTAVLLGTAIAY